MASSDGFKPVAPPAPDQPDLTPLNLPSMPEVQNADIKKTAEGLPYYQARTPAPDGFKPVAGPPPMAGPVHDAIATNGPYSDILHAFGQGFADEWGSAQFGPDLKKMMADHGILDSSIDPKSVTAYGGGGNVAKAFNEVFLRGSANTLDIALRTATGLARGIGDAAVEAGVPKDIVGMTIENPMFEGKIPGRPKLPDLPEAKTLRVIGPTPEGSPIESGTPSQAAAEATPRVRTTIDLPPFSTAETTSGPGNMNLNPANSGRVGIVKEPQPQNLSGAVTPYEDKMMAPAGSPFEQNPFQQRFDQYISKLQTSDDAKNLIQNSVDLNDTFSEARGGQIPAAHLGALSDATGIPVEEMDVKGLRTRLDGPTKFRNATQLMLSLNDKVFEAARSHKTEQSFESRKALVEAIMRYDAAVEYVMGLRSEWGKTGNAMQDFLASTQDSQGLGRFLGERKGKGWNSGKIDEIANELGSMNSREAVGHSLNDMRKPDFLDKAIWYWTNAILSGPITHAKYVFANAAYIAHDTLIATPAAGVSGAIRQALSKDEIERVYMGEAAAKVYGLIAGVPDALYAAGQAVKTGVPTALEDQIRGAGVVNPVTGLKPVGGVAGTVFGAPSNVIAGIHSFYNFLGYRSELQAQAYRKAVKAGYSPLDRDFWQAQKAYVDFTPHDEPMITAAIEAGQRANFVQDLGPSGKALQAMLYKTRIGRFVMPFIKVPGNIFNAVQEGTPLAYLDKRMRDDLNGSGARKDMAMGRLAAGGAVMGWAAYMALGDKLTGNGPVDTKQRAEWLLTHQPNSVRVGDTWKSYDRFGPAGGWLSLSANLTDAAKDLQRAVQDGRMTETERKKADADIQEGGSRVVVGFTRWFAEAGAQGLFDLVSSMNDPNKTHISGAGRIAGSWMPFSSGQAQVASAMDPYVRETQSFIDGIRVMIPGQRQSLLVARDWTGAPIANPAYHSLVKNKLVNTDSVDQEMQRLDLKPGKPLDSIKGVKLTQDQYNEFQDLAGVRTRQALHYFIDQPTWQMMPDMGKALLIEKEIKASRAQAEAQMQMKYPNLISEAIDNRNKEILGQKHKPTAYERP